MSAIGELPSKRAASPKEEPFFSSIADDPPYLKARLHSPLQRNWSWTPPLRGAIHIVQDLQHVNGESEQLFQRGITHERPVAADSILPTLEEETPRPGALNYGQLSSPHPVTAYNGAELLAQLGYEEAPKGVIIWT